MREFINHDRWMIRLFYLEMFTENLVSHSSKCSTHMLRARGFPRNIIVQASAVLIGARHKLDDTWHLTDKRDIERQLGTDVLQK